eukprot:6336519-Lingulodinium_polyedra.AAC.1
MVREAGRSSELEVAQIGAQALAVGVLGGQQEHVGGWRKERAQESVVAFGHNDAEAYAPVRGAEPRRPIALVDLSVSVELPLTRLQRGQLSFDQERVVHLGQLAGEGPQEVA